MYDVGPCYAFVQQETLQNVCQAGNFSLPSCRYMDPGNWATNVAAGSQFGYTLLIVVLLSSMTAVFLQHLSLKLGVVSSRDLAQACRDSYHPKVRPPCYCV